MKLNKSRERIVNILKESLEQETMPWRTPYTIEKPRNPITGVEYKGVNNLLLHLTAIERGINDPRWMTFNQAVKKGYTIKEGAKGVPIEFWSFYNKKTKQNMTPDEAKQWLKTHDKEQDTIYANSKTYHVFSATDMKGIEEYNKSVFHEDLLAYRVLKTYMETENIHLKLSEPAYDYLGDVIFLPRRETFVDQYRYLSVWAHECVHSTGASTRLNRELQVKDRKKYAKEELVAEIGATFLCTDLVLERTDDDMTDHKAYIQSWLRLLEDKPTEFFKAVNQAQKAADFVLEKGDVSRHRTEIEIDYPLENENDLGMEL